MELVLLPPPALTVLLLLPGSVLLPPAPGRVELPLGCAEAWGAEEAGAWDDDWAAGADDDPETGPANEGQNEESAFCQYDDTVV